MLMGAKVLADAIQAGKLTWEQWAIHQAFCIWCLIAALATFVSVGLAVPETVASVKRLFGWA
jgi:hypothetical protein